MNTKLVALILIVVLFMLFATCAGCYNVLPYEDNTVFTIQYPYEGFKARTSNAPKSSNSDSPKSESFTTLKSTMDSVFSTITGKGEKDDKKEPKKVEGFGLMPAPYGVEAPIDRFSALKSEKTCAGSQYSTSTGYLCMDKETERLLRTRGGNISGGDSQIGSQ